jgi:cystathionine beta-lyase family protein involved in aluminum resistance
MEEVIGLRGVAQVGSLCDWGVVYKQLDMTPEGEVDLPAVTEAARSARAKVIYVQRSCGYAMRPTLTIVDIERYQVPFPLFASIKY